MCAYNLVCGPTSPRIPMPYSATVATEPCVSRRVPRLPLVSTLTAVRRPRRCQRGPAYFAASFSPTTRPARLQRERVSWKVTTSRKQSLNLYWQPPFKGDYGRVQPCPRDLPEHRATRHTALLNISASICDPQDSARITLRARHKIKRRLHKAGPPFNAHADDDPRQDIGSVCLWQDVDGITSPRVARAGAAMHERWPPQSRRHPPLTQELRVGSSSARPGRCKLPGDGRASGPA